MHSGAQLAGVPGLTMRLFANVSRVKSVTTNVLAESRKGDPDNVVMAGAHLDSVPEGPGINDNGSGSSALLEVAEQLGKAKTENRLRFAWWGAEEAGLVGSTFYVNDLVANDPDELAEIEMYLNFDMVASPNYGLFRYDGDGSDFGLVGPDGSDEIEAVFTRFYDDVGACRPSRRRSTAGPTTRRSSPTASRPAACSPVPRAQDRGAGGQVGGTAGIAYDPCYHSVCDTIANVNRTALEINADAIAYAVYLFASGDEVLND